jgi:hypothetical protein
VAALIEIKKMKDPADDGTAPSRPWRICGNYCVVLDRGFGLFG